MSRDMRICPHPRCGALVPPDEFACRGHWRTLTDDTRTEIAAARVLDSAEWLDEATDNALAEWGVS